MIELRVLAAWEHQVKGHSRKSGGDSEEPVRTRKEDATFQILIFIFILKGSERASMCS